MFLAAYKGDQFIALGENYEDLAKQLGIQKQTVKFLCSPSAHRRNKGGKTLVYKYQDDEEEKVWM